MWGFGFLSFEYVWWCCFSAFLGRLYCTRTGIFANHVKHLSRKIVVQFQKFVLKSSEQLSISWRHAYCKAVDLARGSTNRLNKDTKNHSSRSFAKQGHRLSSRTSELKIGYPQNSLPGKIWHPALFFVFLISVCEEKSLNFDISTLSRRALFIIFPNRGRSLDQIVKNPPRKHWPRRILYAKESGGKTKIGSDEMTRKYWLLLPREGTHINWRIDRSFPVFHPKKTTEGS